MKKLMGFLSNTYRSRMFRMYCLNCPSSIFVPWKIAKGFLEEVTVRKINIIKASTTPTMFEHINKAQIEKKYGGSARNMEVFPWPPAPGDMVNIDTVETKNKNRFLTVEAYREKHKQGLLSQTKVLDKLIKPETQEEQKIISVEEPAPHKGKAKNSAPQKTKENYLFLDYSEENVEELFPGLEIQIPRWIERSKNNFIKG
jgi:hypothetical protein